MLSPPLKLLRQALRKAGEQRLDEAITILTEGVELCAAQPEHLGSLPRLTLNLALFYRRQLRFREAAAVLQRSLDHFPEDRSLLHFHADLYLSMGDWGSAEVSARRLRSICESVPSTFTSDWAEALALLENRIAVKREAAPPVQ